MLRPEIKAEIDKGKLAVREFIEGAATGDQERMLASIDGIEDGCTELGGGWVCAMRSVSKLRSVPSVTKTCFLNYYVRYGDHLRQECSDLILADALRVLLPMYRGSAKHLYRGESLHNRSRRTYGLSWTASIEVARNHAMKGIARTAKGGSVVLETLAPKEAIICKVPRTQDRYHEEEYIVDRRYLMAVKVTERFSEMHVNDMQLRREAK